MTPYLKVSAWIAACASAVLLGACGGGGGSLSGGGTSTTGGTSTNSIPVTVDAGPAALASAGYAAANFLYATVTICTPGSTTECQTIDHLQVDTGSYGVSVYASALNGSAAPASVSLSGGPLAECRQFADGYTWGSVGTVDLVIGQRKLASMPVNVVGDPAVGTAPASCSSGAGNEISSVASFGANGVLGIGYFLQDCGSDCVGTALSAGYYVCPTSGCVPTAVTLAQQLQNPIGALSADNNGAVIALPAAAANGQATLSGTLYFGIGTESDNGLGTAQFLTVEPADSVSGEPATLLTTFNGTTLAGSVVDSGSNAYYFADSSLAACTDYTGFYCTSASLGGSLQGLNGNSASVGFSVGDADTLFSSTTTLAVFPTLAGPNGSVGNSIPGFDWGLPFFFGRSVYVLFENQKVGATSGPAIGF